MLCVKVSLPVHHQTTFNRQRWLQKPISSGVYHPWLISPDSLTARLKQRYKHFRLQPLSVRLARAELDEAQLLRMKRTLTPITRQVLLCNSQDPVVFAHSILPKKSLRGEWVQLGKLGNKPLGEALFANPRVTRTPLMYKKLTPQHTLYKKAVAHVVHAPRYLWARRSVFRLGCDMILVTEVFLPSLVSNDPSKNK